MIRVILVCSTNGGTRVDLPCHAVLHVHYYLQNPEMDIIECRVDSLKHLGCSFLFSLHQLMAYYQRTPSGNISSNMYYVGKNTFGRIEENHTLEDTETYQPTCYTKPSCD